MILAALLCICFTTGGCFAYEQKSMYSIHAVHAMMGIICSILYSMYFWRYSGMLAVCISVILMFADFRVFFCWFECNVACRHSIPALEPTHKVCAVCLWTFSANRKFGCDAFRWLFDFKSGPIGKGHILNGCSERMEISIVQRQRNNRRNRMNVYSLFFHWF